MMRNKLLACLLLLFSAPSLGIWYEAEGRAAIYSGDVASARERATQQAIQNALVLAGGTVTSLQEVAAGKIVNDQFEIRTAGTVRDVRVLSERRSGDTLFITIHADLFPQQLQCQNGRSRKSLLLTRFKVNDRINARTGSIDEIGLHTSQWLYDHLRAESLHSYPKRWLNEISTFNPSLYNNRSVVSPLLPLVVTEKTNTQLVLFAEIRDLSFNGDLPVRKWQQWLYSPPERNFELMVYLIDGISGELTLERSYRSKAPWEFKAEEAVALGSRQFWESAYGNAVSDVMSQLLTDIDTTLSCTPGRGRITHVRNDAVEVDIGVSNGIRVGDRLTLLHRAAHDGQDNQQHVRLLPTTVQLRITESYQNRAVARVTDPALLSGVQIHDLVELTGTL
ncbi:hypothetical protein DU002_17770 [Corallincola holothuriorum]|uniref:Flagellar biosynthesis protein FlgT n=1 Tax=Corallincola holothuriorum TaxID=2282215 RepID=A0A368N324_9GAMM|nr:flagellar assembly protein T N-terminal domain-containing protein [Corallincola holothuriorum]RCU44606.1 hypothetical protein DU002_17770 [Corallincola holothuriorum]